MSRLRATCMIFKDACFYLAEWILHDCFNTRDSSVDLHFAPSQEEMSQVLDAMFEKFCTEGEHIIDQDDDGDNFYVIER